MNFQLTDFEIGDTLGTGTLGRRALLQHIESSQYYALKMLKSRRSSG